MKSVEILKRNALGIGLSSFIILLSKLIFQVETITPIEIGFNFLIAIVVSNLSFLDHIERLNYWQITLFHFIGTYIFLIAGYFYLYPFKQTNFFDFSLNVVIIYIIIWLLFVTKNFLIAKQLNRQLKEK